MFKLENDEALELLVNRVKYWTHDEVSIDLFSKMYKDYLESGVFEENNYTIAEIVDNDWVNNCQIVTLPDLGDDSQKVVECYKGGERGISCEDLGYSFIEAADDEENPTTFLMRS